MNKVLVVGVILLFLSVCLQPALANEVPITETSEVEKDCGCQGVKIVELLRYKLLLIKTEAITNVILSNFGHKPEITKKCQEISYRVSVLREMINEFKPDTQWENYPIICSILLILIIQSLLLIECMFYITQIFPVLYNIYEIIAELIGELIISPITILFRDLECIELP